MIYHLWRMGIGGRTRILVYLEPNERVWCMAANFVPSAGEANILIFGFKGPLWDGEKKGEKGRREGENGRN